MNGNDASLVSSASAPPIDPSPSSTQHSEVNLANERSPALAQNESSSGPSVPPRKDDVQKEQNAPVLNMETGQEDVRRSQESSSAASEESQDWVPEGDHELKRVKVCPLF
jgi:hypothetical protein